MREFEFVITYNDEEDGKSLTVICAKDEETAVSTLKAKYKVTTIYSVRLRGGESIYQIKKNFPFFFKKY